MAGSVQELSLDQQEAFAASAKTDLSLSTPIHKAKGRRLARIEKKISTVLGPGDNPRKKGRLPGENQATWAFIFGLCGMLVLPLLGIPGLFLGIAALRKYNQGLHDEKTFAILGIVFGAICLFSTALVAFLLFGIWRL